MGWLKKIADLARRAAAYWRAMPDEDKEKAKDAARKLSERVLKKEKD